jgi:hypothetical protein
MPAEYSAFLACQSDEFDLKTTGDHAVFEFDLPSDTQFYHQLGIEVEITEQSGTQLTPAVLSIGDNASNYNNLVTAMSVGGALGDIIQPNLSNSRHPIARADGHVRVKVVTAATGIGLTLKGKVIVSGYLANN